MDVVQSLVDKSFVRLLAGARFDLLVSVQDYAAEHLRTEGRFPAAAGRQGRRRRGTAPGSPLWTQYALSSKPGAELPRFW